MKFMCLNICFILITFTQSGFAGSGMIQKEVVSEKVSPLVMYGVYPTVLTSYSYGVEDVIRTHDYSVNVRDPRRADINSLLGLLEEIKKGEKSKEGVFSLRFVCMLVKGASEYTFGFEGGHQLLFIDGALYDRSEKTERLIDILKKYIPPVQLEL